MIQDPVSLGLVCDESIIKFLDCVDVVLEHIVEIDEERRVKAHIEPDRLVWDMRVCIARHVHATRDEPTEGVILWLDIASSDGDGDTLVVEVGVGVCDGVNHAAAMEKIMKDATNIRGVDL